MVLTEAESEQGRNNVIEFSAMVVPFHVCWQLLYASCNLGVLLHSLLFLSSRGCIFEFHLDTKYLVSFILLLVSDQVNQVSDSLSLKLSVSRWL